MTISVLNAELERIFWLTSAIICYMMSTNQAAVAATITATTAARGITAGLGNVFEAQKVNPSFLKTLKEIPENCRLGSL